MSVSVNPPKTPVTKGSSGIAAATIPNICKMPGPPAPFVPAPLPNIGKSGDSPKGYSKKVKIEGNPVAIKGASFKSIGDMASKGTGGGIISANTHGPTKFVGPGSMDVKIEGKNVQLLSDPMLNNCGPSGSPPNSATLLGVLQAAGLIAVTGDECPLCNEAPHEGLMETDATQEDAGDLEAAYDARRQTAPRRHWKKRRATMLGAVRCKTDERYADQSGPTSDLLVGAAQDCRMHHPDAGTGAAHVLERIQHHAGNDAICEELFEQAATYAQESADDETLPIGYPPGSCAAQGALVLCLDDGGLPIAMTERWFSPSGEPTGRPIRYIEASEDGVWTVNDRQFNPGETVPPCSTCEVLVELLLCFKEEDECNHG